MATVKNHLNARGGLRRTLLVVLVACNTAIISTGTTAGSAAVGAPAGITIVSQKLGSPVRRPTYGWPLKPFNRPHPVRAYLNDPRISADGSARSFHFGIDIGVPEKKAVPVYAVESGTARLVNGFALMVWGKRTFGYWHVIPVVRPGQHVRKHQLIGRSMGWNHIHFAEYSGGQWVNPLRPGGLGPFSDGTVPTLEKVTFERNSVALDPNRVNGTCNLVLVAFDTSASIQPAPWPVAPASIRWRLVRGERPLTGWNSVLESQTTLPKDQFASVYAAGTAQNHPGYPGLYRFSLAKAWRSTSLPNGSYAVEIRSADIRSNTVFGRVGFTVDNG